MSGLRIEDFDVFFREIHGVAPFEWQRQLAWRVDASAPCNECAAQGLNFERCTHVGWPPTIDLPTASGKTAVIDIAIFTLALDPSPTRRAPLRIFFVVDRRVVVDEAHRRAAKIAASLASATDGVVHTVADRLHAISGEGADPFVTAVLRGGIYREDNWARSPIQPLVVVSTVDQVGSRLLGRGYGVGDAMKPVHQGLVGHDSLIILDEAHLSDSFRETLEALRGYAAHADVRLPRPFQLVVMSATPRLPGSFRLGPNHPDREDRLRPRLEAQKRPELRLVDVGKPPAKSAARREHEKWREGRKERDTKFCEEVAKAAGALLGVGGVRCLGVVVNRVGTARQVFEKLRQDSFFDAVLLTGRSRPLDSGPG
jgi:CRISPR-associated endonuclease/helicase Cas3